MGIDGIAVVSVGEDKILGNIWATSRARLCSGELLLVPRNTNRAPM